MSLQKGLVGHWTMDQKDVSGSTLYDSSANDHHGNISGPSVDSNSIFGQSLRFTHDSHEVDLSSVPIIAVEKSISFWLRSNRSLDTNDEWQVGFLDGPGNQGSMFGMMFGVGDTQDLGYWGYGSTYDVNIGSKSNKWASNDNWRHIVLTMDSNNDVRIYIDGQQATNLVANDGTDYGSVITGLSNTESGFKLNSRNNWSDHTNRISDLRVYNRSLSESEISALYNMRSQRQQNTSTLMNTTVNGEDVVLQRDSFGSWICVQNYEHYGGTNPTPSPTSTFPQLPNGLRQISDIQSDAVNGELRHVDNITQYGSWNVDAVRLEAMTSNHGRKIHYLSENQSVIDAVVDDSVDVGHSELKDSLTKYPDHTSFLPDDMAADNDNQTDPNSNRIFGYGFPMYGDGSDGTRVHWAVQGNGNRWEVDDYPGGAGQTTIHRVWVRTGLFD